MCENNELCAEMSRVGMLAYTLGECRDIERSETANAVPSTDTKYPEMTVWFIFAKNNKEI